MFPSISNSVAEALTELLREDARLPEAIVEGLNDPERAEDYAKQLSGELPAALYEKLGLLPEGYRHVVQPGDFLEGGLVDRQLRGSVWLGPQQEAVQRPRPSAQRTMPGKDEMKAEMGSSKALLRQELGRSVPGATILRQMADAAFSLAEEIRKAGLSSKKRAEAERKRAPPVTKSHPLDAVLAEVRTGDLLLLQSEAFSARFITHAMRCEYAHLAVVVRLPKLPGTVFLLEADPDAHFVEASGETRWHLQLVDARSRLSSWLDGANNYVSVRTLLRPATAAVGAESDQLLELLCPPRDAWDKPSGRRAAAPAAAPGAGDRSARNHMQALVEALYGLPFAHEYARLNAMEGLASLRSAEAVCLAYRALGALPAAFDASSLTLADFNLSPPFDPGWSLGPLIGITAEKSPWKRSATGADWDRPSKRIAEITEGISH